MYVRSPEYIVSLRGMAATFVLGICCVFTLVSFWSLYYWPLVLALLLLYVTVNAYSVFRPASRGLGTAHAHYAFYFTPTPFASSRERLAGWLNLLLIIVMLMALAEVINGIVEIASGSGPTLTVFQAIAAMTGGVTVIAAFFVRVASQQLVRVYTGGASSGSIFGRHDGDGSGGHQGVVYASPFASPAPPTASHQYFYPQVQFAAHDPYGEETAHYASAQQRQQRLYPIPPQLAQAQPQPLWFDGAYNADATSLYASRRTGVP